MKTAEDQLTAPPHNHSHSVYVRCRDCLTFGIPMPGEYICGNCNSFNTYSLVPACCVTAYAEERVKEAHVEIAAKQALINGESVMLGGKLVTNEELYKQSVDYIREARAEALEEAANKILKAHTCLRDCKCLLFAEAIRALKDKP